MDKSIKKIKDIVKNIFEITYELFRIMIPTLIVVKILQEFGFVDILNKTHIKQGFSVFFVLVRNPVRSVEIY